MNFLNLIERKRDGNDLSADEVVGLVEQFTADKSLITKWLRSSWRSTAEA